MTDKRKTYSVLEYVELSEWGLGEPKTDYRIVKGGETLVKVYEYPTNAVNRAVHHYYDESPGLQSVAIALPEDW